MDNDKRCTLTVEVPRKRPKLKDVLIEASMAGLKEAVNALSSIISQDNNRTNVELTIDVPKIKLPSDKESDTATESSSQEETDNKEEE